MAEEENNQQEPEKNQQEPEAEKSPDFEKIQQELEQYKTLLSQEKEKSKKELAGLNRKISELEKASLTEKEKEEREKEEARQEAEQAKQEALQYRTQLAREKMIYESGLKPDDSLLINAPDEEGIQKQVEYLKQRDEALLAEERKKWELERSKTRAPSSGGNSGNLTYEDLMKMSEEELQKLPPGFTEKIFGGK
jgi:hypothetical protein